MGRFRYRKKYYKNKDINNYMEAYDEIKERILGYIWKELENNTGNILIGPLKKEQNYKESTYDTSECDIYELSMQVDVSLVKNYDNKIEIIDDRPLNVNLDKNVEDTKIQIKPKANKKQIDIDDDLFEDNEKIKFDEEHKIESIDEELQNHIEKASYAKEIHFSDQSGVDTSKIDLYTAMTTQAAKVADAGISTKDILKSLGYFKSGKIGYHPYYDSIDLDDFKTEKKMIGIDKDDEKYFNIDYLKEQVINSGESLKSFSNAFLGRYDYDYDNDFNKIEETTSEKIARLNEEKRKFLEKKKHKKK
ncbi:MAG: hypothetical protein WC934_13625 [Acidithiobacillus sp.]|jgi:hypothetical protein|uniref:hypothetical protein n=1 Tax=Acidithiobacillus sp. TaxID=1872118 RepID=UPI00355DD15E